MPNHCQNVMTVVGKEDTVRAFVDKVQGPGPNYPSQGFGRNALPEGERMDPKDLPISVLSFHQTVPIPEDVQCNSYGDGGAKSGYNVERELWGVKWGAYDEQLVRHEPTYAKYAFTTAWGPPVEWLQKTSELFPDLTFFVSYSEESPSRGKMQLKNGELLVDLHESYPFDENYPEYDEDLATSDPNQEDAHWEECSKHNEKYVRAHDYWVGESVSRGV